MINRKWETKHLLFIIYLAFGPIHQIFDIFRCRQRRWLFECFAISPQVFVSWSTRHGRACRLIAILWYSAIDEIDSIEKVHNYFGNNDRKSVWSNNHATNSHNKQHLPCTAIQSFIFSPSGNLTTCRKLMPDCRLACACLCNEYRIVPWVNRFFGRNVCPPMVNVKRFNTNEREREKKTKYLNCKQHFYYWWEEHQE